MQANRDNITLCFNVCFACVYVCVFAWCEVEDKMCLILLRPEAGEMALIA